MAASSTKHQLNLPPSLLQVSEQGAVVLQRSEQADSALQTSEPGVTDETRLASEVFDAAAKACGLSTPDIGHLCGVSDALVYKWRSPERRECPSFVQMLMLPPAFHLALHRQLNKRFGFGRAALARLLDAVGDLALVVNE